MPMPLAMSLSLSIFAKDKYRMRAAQSQETARYILEARERERARVGRAFVLACRKRSTKLTQPADHIASAILQMC